MKFSVIIKFIVSIAVPLIIGFLGSIATASSVNTWYQTIKKPVFTPPNWLFGPVWTLLFILMGIAFFLVWHSKNTSGIKLAVIIFFIQIVLNLLWSVFFFGLRNPWLAFFDIVVLWFFILTNTILFYRISHSAGYLLIPYLLWVSFASILNLSVAMLNFSH